MTTSPYPYFFPGKKKHVTVASKACKEEEIEAPLLQFFVAPVKHFSFPNKNCCCRRQRRDFISPLLPIVHLGAKKAAEMSHKLT